jgi:hypothetical protein
MKTYKFCFEGRQVGAIGKTYYNVKTFRATSLKGAIKSLYKI